MEAESEGEDVGNTIRVDSPETHIIHQPPESKPSPGGGFLQKAALAGLTAAGLSTPIGVGAWLVADAIRNQPAQPTVQQKTEPTQEQPAVDGGKTIFNDYKIGEPKITAP